MEAHINQIDGIIDTYCDCPYDLGEFCKHQTAVLYALKSKNVKQSVAAAKETKQDLKSILSNLNKEELMNILLDLASEDRNLEIQLVFKYGQDENEVSASKKLIKEYIQKAKKRGFIDWKHVDYALQGADLVLQKVQANVERGKTEVAVSLVIAVLGNVVDMLQFSDDSNGSVGDIIRYCFHLIDETIGTQIWQLNEKEKKKLFDMVLKEELNKRFNDWDEWRFELLGACVPFCQNEKLRAKLESQIES